MLVISVSFAVAPLHRAGCERHFGFFLAEGLDDLPEACFAGDLAAFLTLAFDGPPDVAGGFVVKPVVANPVDMVGTLVVGGLT